MSFTAQRRQQLIASSLHLAGAAAVALAMGIFYLAVYWPLENQAIAHETRAEQIDALFAHSPAVARKYRELRDRLASVQASVDQLHLQLAHQQTEKTAIDSLTEIAKNTNLEIIDYDLGHSQRLAAYSVTELELQCHGSYDSICRFLAQAEQFTKTAKLSRFELGSAANFERYPIQLTFVLYSEGQSHDTKEGRGVL